MENAAENMLKSYLSNIYSSFDDASLNIDLAYCNDLLRSLNRTLSKKRTLNSLELYRVLDDFEKASLYANKVVSFVNLSLLADNDNIEAQLFSNKSNKLSAEIGMINAMLRKIVQRIDKINQYIDEYSALDRFKEFLVEIINSSNLYSSAETEAVISKLQQTGSRAWQRLRDRLEASAAITADLQGETRDYTLTELRSLSSNLDKSIRKKAYFSELALCRSIEIPLAACINGIKGEGIETTKMRGYESVLDWMLGINKMSSATLEMMFNKLEEHLPLFQAHLIKRSQILGHKNGLPWYDLSAPLNKESQKLSVEKSCELIIAVFKRFDPDMADFYEHVLKNRWVDFYPRKGKSGGALCADIASIKENRIHINFNGSTSDVRLLAHELGHAYHSRCLDEYPLIMRDPPTPLCETASIFNEIILQEGLWSLVSEEQKEMLIDVSTRENTQTIVDIYSRFIFEKELFTRLDDHELSSSELCAIMTDAQRIAYGDSLDPDFLHPYMWIPKVHYYIPDFHYYNFPYIFGLLLSKGLYSDYRLNPEDFITRYNNLLKSSCSGSVEEILENAGFNISQAQFWDGAFRELAGDLENFDRLI